MKGKTPRSKSPQRRLPKQERAHTMVEAALEATKLLLADIGYEATTTTKIAERAGMSVGSLYQYFPNRDAIIGELQRRHHTQTSAILEAAFSEVKGMPLEDAVRRLVRATVDLHRNEPELHRVLTEIVPSSVNSNSRNAMSKKIEFAQKKWFESVAAELGLKNIEATAFVVRETVEGSIHRAVIHGHDTMVDVIADEVCAFLIKYLKK